MILTVRSESSRERNGQGTKGPGSESARVLLADLLRGTNWPGSEKARYPCANIPHLTIHRASPVYSQMRFTAFSLPGQFAPRSESANRTLANSLPGPLAPWNLRSRALSLPGLLITRLIE